MDNQLKLNLILNDEQFVSAIKKAQEHTHKLEEHTSHLNEKMKEAFNVNNAINHFGSKMIEAISIVGLMEKAFEGVGEAIEKAFDLGKEAFTEFRKLTLEQGRIGLLLSNSPHDESLNARELDKMATERSESLGIKKAEAVELERQLLNTRSLALNEKLFKQTEQISYDIAAAHGTTAKEEGSKLAGALQNPRQMRALLKEAGVLDFHVLQALKVANQDELLSKKLTILSLDAINEKYKGAAEKIAEIDPLTPWNKAWNRFEEELGPKVAQLFTKVEPTFNKFVDQASEWIASITEEDVDRFAGNVNTIISATEVLAKGLLWLAEKVDDITGGFTVHKKEIFEDEYMKSHPDEKFWTDAQNQAGIGLGYDARGQRERFDKWRKELPIYKEVENFLIGEKRTGGDLTKATSGGDIWTKWIEDKFGAKKFGANEQEYGSDIAKLNSNKIVELTMDANKLAEFQAKESDKFGKEGIKNAQNAQKKLEDVTKEISDTKGKTITGVQPKQIIINIAELVHEIKNSFTGGVQESSAEIERIITTAIINGIQAGEMLSN